MTNKNNKNMCRTAKKKKKKLACSDQFTLTKENNENVCKSKNKKRKI